MCSREKGQKALENWSYEDQAAWVKFPNFYSVSRIPINIDESKVIKCKRLEVDFRIDYRESVTGIIENTDGNDIPVFYPDKPDNYLYYGNRKYSLINFHFHNASENTVNGEYFPAEVHFVHKVTENKIDYYFVVGMLLKLVPTGGLQITDDFFISEGQIKTYNLSVFNKLSKCVRYDFPGTLTTPPFYENCYWALFNAYDVNSIVLGINQLDYDEFIHNYINTKCNVQCQYQDSRYVNGCKNYLKIRKVNL